MEEVGTNLYELVVQEYLPEQVDSPGCNLTSYLHRRNIVFRTLLWWTIFGCTGCGFRLVPHWTTAWYMRSSTMYASVCQVRELVNVLLQW